MTSTPAANKPRHLLTQLRKRMLIFCSTSVLSRTFLNSSKEMRLSLSTSASMMVLSAIDTSCSSPMLAPTWEGKKVLSFRVEEYHRIVPMLVQSDNMSCGRCCCCITRMHCNCPAAKVMGNGVRCGIPHFCIFVTDTQRVSPNLEPESALDASC